VGGEILLPAHEPKLVAIDFSEVGEKNNDLSGDDKREIVEEFTSLWIGEEKFSENPRKHILECCPEPYARERYHSLLSEKKGGSLLEKKVVLIGPSIERGKSAKLT